MPEKPRVTADLGTVRGLLAAKKLESYLARNRRLEPPWMMITS